MSSSQSRPVLFGPLPVPYLSLARPLPVPYPSLTCLASLGLSRSHKGTGTDTIFDFSHHHHPPPTTSKLFRSLYSPLSISHPFLTGHLPLPYSYTPPLHLDFTYPSLTPYSASYKPSRPLKGTGTDTIFDFSTPTHPPPLNFLEAFIVA